MTRWLTPRLPLVVSLAAVASLGLATVASAQQAGPPALYCNRTFSVGAGATAITQFAAGVAGQSLHVCGIFINAGAAAGTFQISTGTGSNCGTNTAAVTPAFSLGINGTMVIPNTVVWWSSPAANALCYTITGTGPIQAIVSYGQY